ncbi:hypothetical protein DIS18_08740 [Algibacter marinivivus]|uniref:ATPase domain-containing protein n=1 Tax=Algibacter marinivivus TaxID=2100723 RepID=A0A2U2X3I9_9FLAO|nr:hypothetical protein [Algibacter marinivivus]PWH82330.1 hypothetical protein DIS18_08740 [Algibacter marinivivus]
MENIKPLTPSTGSVLTPEQVIGREDDVKKIIDILEKQGVCLNAVRRFGKSSLLLKVKNVLNGMPNYMAVYLDVEGLSSCDSLIGKLYNEFKNRGLVKESTIKKIDIVFNKLLDRFKKLGIASLLEIELNEREQFWEKKLETILIAAIEENPGKKLIICLDEFSILLDSIENKRESILLIGILRALVHNENLKNHVRFIYCGSIGIDLVIAELKKLKVNFGKPLNHMHPYELEPLSKEDALLLCKCFNNGCNLDVSDDLMDKICVLCDNIPYYIDGLYSLFRYEPIVNVDIIDVAYKKMLDDSNGKFEFDHFYERIKSHYPEKKISLHLLNVLSKESGWVSESKMFELVNAKLEVDRYLLIDEAERLWKDKYLRRESGDEGRYYKFKYQVLKDWWEVNKSY